VTTSHDELSLAVFLPIDRRFALAGGDALPEAVEGAALLGDLSGFTSLAREFAAQLGPQRGAEAMRRCIGDVAHALVTEVHARRGAVVGFTGDGLTCWFDGDDGRQALGCGLAMQAALAVLPPLRLPNGDERTLRLKVAVASGPARRVTVGDPSIQRIDALVGHTVERVAASELAAEPGEVIADDATVAPIRASLDLAAPRASGGATHHAVTAVRDAPPRAPWGEAPAIDDGTAAPWVHARVRERLRAAGSAYLTELRLVVVVMVRLGSEGDPTTHLDARVRRRKLFVFNMLHLRAVNYWGRK